MKGIKLYLAAYNLVAFISWLLYFIFYASNNFTLNSTSLLLLNIAQGLAVLEVLHALLKWVKSPIGSTAAQVASRILVLVLINVFLKDASLSSIVTKGVLIVSFAWTITELVRYSYYFLLLFDIHPKPLLWMRYTFFIVLYPLGVTGEWFIIAAPIVVHGFLLNFYTAFVLINLVAYAYYFPVLYKYMWKQRGARL